MRVCVYSNHVWQRRLPGQVARLAVLRMLQGRPRSYPASLSRRCGGVCSQTEVYVFAYQELQG